MNWKSGFLRIWVVLSLGWAVLTIAMNADYTWKQYWFSYCSISDKNSFFERQCKNISDDLSLKKKKFIIDGKEVLLTPVLGNPNDERSYFQVAKDFLFLLLLPPASLLLLGLITGWVFSGFRQNRNN